MIRGSWLPAVLLLASCAGSEIQEVPAPGNLALELFEIAREEDPAPERLDALFELGHDDRLRAELGDALELLAVAVDPQIVRVEPMAGPGKTAVDLVAGLPGGGSADYSVQFAEREGVWKIVWFDGPGVDWPTRSRGRDEGLSSSPAPGGGSG